MTICSISTAPGIGAIAVVRVSGPDAFRIVGTLTSDAARFAELPANTAKLVALYDGDALVDQVVAVKYAAPHSYDGDDMVELSCHGSPYIQKRLLELLLQRGCRLADRGEFTLRAFMNGKMDLPQAEAVADLISSQSESAHRLAVRQLKGGFSRKIGELREEFVRLAALLELELDFSEEDVEFADRRQLRQLLAHLREEVQRLTRSFHTGNALKNGVPVAIVGQPNVGKSTLLNALLDDDRAIVSDIPGTTRDTVEETLLVDGTLFRFIDTAGLRASDDVVESSGIERTLRAAANADVIFYLVDAATATPDSVGAELATLRRAVPLDGKQVLLVVNKVDAAPAPARLLPPEETMGEVRISAKGRQHLDGLRDTLTRYVAAYHVGDDTLLTNARHYDLMLKIGDDIDRVERGLTTGLPTDLVAEDVRGILDKLGQLTGAITTDDVLDTVFGKFCIGK